MNVLFLDGDGGDGSFTARIGLLRGHIGIVQLARAWRTRAWRIGT
jgi:hypothetical protein